MPGEPWNIEESDTTEDVYPPWPNDCELDWETVKMEDVIERIKESGNFYFRKKNYTDSDRKYKKALRYIDWLISNKRACNISNINSMKINSLLNLAAVRLKKNKLKDVVEICSQVRKSSFDFAFCVYQDGNVIRFCSGSAGYLKLKKLSGYEKMYFKVDW